AGGGRKIGFDNRIALERGVFRKPLGTAPDRGTPAVARRLSHVAAVLVGNAGNEISLAIDDADQPVARVLLVVQQLAEVLDVEKELQWVTRLAVLHHWEGHKGNEAL